MKRVALWVLACAGLALLVVLASFPLCPRMSSFDSCSRLSVCSAGYTDGTDGPGWFCVSKWAR